MRGCCIQGLLYFKKMSNQFGYMSKEWSRDMNLQLIAELKKRRSLWDQRSLDYKDKDKRKMDYQEIAAIFLSPCSEVKKKIHNLKSQFRREYKKSKANSSTPYKSQWYGFSFMKFLKEDTEENTSKSSFKKGSDFKRKMNLEADVSSSTLPTANIMPDLIERELDNREAFRNSKDLFYNRRVNENVQTIDRDENTVFGEYVTYELKKISNPYIIAVTKHKIQECLFEAQMSMISSTYNFNENCDRLITEVSQNFDECVTTSTSSLPT